jgi:N4-gp56 family major capsid protein
MALGTDHVILSEVPNFVPELWSDEVLAAYKKNLVLANLVRKLNHAGKKGDTIKIPTPARAAASTKQAETQVTLIQHGTDTGTSISIDKHKEYSRLIEDIVALQALESLRSFYVDDAGYALSKEVDTRLIFEAASAGFTVVEDAGKIDSTSTVTTVYEGDGTAWDQTASTDISDAGIRTFIKLLDDEDAPHEGRVLVVPTIVKYDLLGTQRFTEQAFTGEAAGANTIRNGLIGDVYNMPVYVTTNLPLVEDSAANADNVLGLCFQRDALVLAEQQTVRTQTQYKQEYLADLFTADTIFGVKALRTGSIINFVVPTT